jgi:hypothetical protein
VAPIENGAAGNPGTIGYIGVAEAEGDKREHGVYFAL